LYRHQNKWHTKKMINLTTLSVEHITKQYDSALLDGAGNLAPRNGYYHILSFEYKTINGKANIPIIRANWKAKREDVFIEDAIFEVAISCLDVPRVNNMISPKFLIGFTYEVYNMSMSYELQNGKRRATVKGKCLQLHQPGEFFNRTEAIFQLLGVDRVELEDGTVKVMTDELYGIHYDDEAYSQDLSLDYDGDPENQNGPKEQDDENDAYTVGN
jgi:hypothetical protein